jgi:hypothetical protein
VYTQGRVLHGRSIDSSLRPALNMLQQELGFTQQQVQRMVRRQADCLRRTASVYQRFFSWAEVSPPARVCMR